MCGNTLLAAPPVEPDGPTLFTKKHTPSQPGFSKWLFFVGLSLALVPANRIYSITQKEIPALFGEDSQSLLTQYPGVDKLIYFQIAMNALLVVAAFALNYLFYTQSKHFPRAMIVYVAVTLGYLIAAAGITHALFPDLVLTQKAYSLMEYFFGGAAMAVYLLFNPDVKNRFVH